MKYSDWADLLWYSGHVITGFAITVMNPHRLFLGVSLVVVGQSLTIISRPIGRIPEKENSETQKIWSGEKKNGGDDRPTVITI
jgi:hypothetical protein